MNVRRRRLEVFGFAWPGGGSTSFRWPIHVRAAAIRAARGEDVSMSCWLSGIFQESLGVDGVRLRDELAQEAKERGLSVNPWLLAAVRAKLGLEVG
jgi:predicted HicB family RNase H-like nuclease